MLTLCVSIVVVTHCYKLVLDLLHWNKYCRRNLQMIKASRNNHKNYFLFLEIVILIKEFFQSAWGGRRGAASHSGQNSHCYKATTPPPPTPTTPPHYHTNAVYKHSATLSAIRGWFRLYSSASFVCVRSQTRKQGEYNRKTGFIKIFCSLCLLAIVKRPSIVGGWPPSSF